MCVITILLGETVSGCWSRYDHLSTTTLLSSHSNTWVGEGDQSSSSSQMGCRTHRGSCQLTCAAMMLNFVYVPAAAVLAAAQPREHLLITACKDLSSLALFPCLCCAHCCCCLLIRTVSMFYFERVGLTLTFLLAPCC